MEKCIFCGKKTSFTYSGEGVYHGKIICPKCMSENLGTNFNTGCNNKDTCVKKIR